MKEIAIYIPFIVCIIGLAMYLFLENAKGQEVGRIGFKAGLLVCLLALIFGR